MEPTRVGVLVDRTDPAALAAGLQVVLADEADRRRVVAAGPAAVRAAFCGNVSTASHMHFPTRKCRLPTPFLIASPASSTQTFCDWCDWVGLQQRMCS
ncbi:hypothetical protein GGQ02_003137 [Salinibacter ruber]|uniref:hypothetical protein n=1 Tax=Salinibacter ruber TaxID=146919 RepID=UPI002166F03B|nr:hypothetical protein [Salinibacter ruber]MCS4034727.1 hypothetical protein [Salinibacter ruber]